jgi:hypothetical protein
MKFIKENIVSILLVALAVLVTLQLQSLFGGSKQAPDISGEIKAKDAIIEMIKTEREQDRREYDSTISLLMQKDQQKVIEYKTTKVIYEKIPVRVGNYSNDELRSAAESFR